MSGLSRLFHGCRLICAVSAFAFSIGCGGEEADQQASKAPPDGQGVAGNVHEADASARTESLLDDEQQQYLWDVEHLGFIVEQTIFPVIRKAIQSRDYAAVQAFLRDDFSVDVPADRKRAADGNAVFRNVAFHADSDSETQTLDADGFVEWLTDRRSEFDESSSACSVGLGLVRFSPRDRGDLGGGWSTVWRLRLAGGRENQPLETVLDLELDLTEFADDSTEQTDWIESARVVRMTSTESYARLMADVTEKSGINVGRLYDSWTGKKGSIPHTGGVYVTDFDNDDHLDLFISDLMSGPYLYKGHGDGTFSDVTSRSGIKQTPPGQTTPWTLSCWGDFDGDGDEDLISGPFVYQNRGNGRFREIRRLTELQPTPASGYAVGDYDLDGNLDLYVCHSTPYRPNAKMQVHVPWIDGGRGVDNVMWQNHGTWAFADATGKTGSQAGGSSCFAAVYLYANDDAYPDLLAINEFGKNALLLGSKSGKFSETTIDPLFGGLSMGVTVGDWNNDGKTDVYVSNMYSKAGNRILANVDSSTYPDELYRKVVDATTGNKLYTSRGDGTFEVVDQKEMIADVGWAYGASFADFDGDGWLDLYSTAGFKSVKRDKPDG